MKIDRYRKRLPVAALLLSCPFLYSQAPQESMYDKDIFELSPFLVDTSADVGYLAQNSLAGSRLNTNLKDIGAAVDVFTAEFLADIGATNVETALAYGNNTQEFLGDDNRGMQQDFKNQAQVSGRFSVRGLETTRARDFLSWALPMDTFSIERFDQSRGPNSILFGIGSAGGVINSSSKKAQIAKDATRFGLMVGSDDLWRATLDLNRVVIQGKLAVRLNLMHHEAGSWREWEYLDKKGLQAAVTYRPFKNTTIRADYQTGEENDIGSRTYLVLNRAHYWDLLGRATYDPGAIMIRNARGEWVPTGTTKGGPYNGWKLTDYQAANDYGNKIAAFNPAGNDWAINFPNVTNFNTNNFRFITNDSGYLIQDKHRFAPVHFGSVPMTDAFGTTVTLSGPGGERALDYRTFSIFVEQKITDQFFIEGAYSKTSSTWSSYNTGNTTFMTADPNTHFFLGTKEGSISVENPYAGKYYFEDDWQLETRRNDNEFSRITASYELDAGKWGLHRVAAMYSKERMTGGKHVEQLQALYQPGDQIPGVSSYAQYVPENANYRIFTRHYVTDENNPADFRNGNWRLIPSTASNHLTGESVDMGFVTRTQGWQEDEADVMLLSFQNYWLDGKVVTTYGLRRDDTSITQFDYAKDRNDIDGDGDTNEILRDPNRNNVLFLDKNEISYENSEAVDTKTYGLVWHIRPWVSASANYSDNTQAPGSAWGAPNLVDPIDPEAGTGVDAVSGSPGTGIGRDYGLKFDLYKSRYFVNLNYYEVEATGNIVWANDIAHRFNRILSVLGSSDGFEMYNKQTGEYLGVHKPIIGSYKEVRITSRDEDFKSKGFEVQFTANPTNSFRFRLNYSYNERDTSNVYQRTRDYANRWREWLPGFMEDRGVSIDNVPVYRFANLATEWSPNIAYHDTIDDADSDPDTYMMYADDVLDYYVDYWIDDTLEGFAEKFGQRPHKLNAFFDYSFDDGRLKGAGVGLGIRWQSGAEVGFIRKWDESTNSMQRTGDIATTDSLLATDLKISYETKLKLFGRKVDARFQLNVANLLDDSGTSPARTAFNRFGEEITTRMYNNRPRSYQFSGTFSF